MLQHDHTEWNPRYPTHEADDGKDTEQGEYHRGAVILLHEIIHGGADAEDDVQNPRDPDELLGEGAGEEEVGVGEDESGEEDEEEEGDGVGVEGEGVGGVVDAAAAEGVVGAVAV